MNPYIIGYIIFCIIIIGGVIGYYFYTKNSDNNIKTPPPQTPPPQTPPPQTPPPQSDIRPRVYSKKNYIWNVGDTIGSLDDAKRRCESENPQGCKIGLVSNNTMVMSSCPNGYADVGLYCNLYQ